MNEHSFHSFFLQIDGSVAEELLPFASKLPSKLAGSLGFLIFLADSQRQVNLAVVLQTQFGLETDDNLGLEYFSVVAYL